MDKSEFADCWLNGLEREFSYETLGVALNESGSRRTTRFRCVANRRFGICTGEAKGNGRENAAVVCPDEALGFDAGLPSILRFMIAPERHADS